MLLSSGRLAVRAAAVAMPLGLVLVLTAGPAQAVADWDTVGQLESAKLQACKVRADGGDAWKVRLRVRNGNDYRVQSRVTVFEGERETARTWASGWVADGQSTTGAVKTGTGDRWRVSFAISADQFGDGGEQRVSGIGRC